MRRAQGACLLACALSLTPAVVFMPITSVAAAVETITVDGQARTIAGENIYRAADTAVIYTGSVSPANQWGWEAAVVNGKITEVRSFQPGMPIPSGGYVISAHGVEADWYAANAQVGDPVARAGEPPPAPAPPGGASDTTATINGVSRPINGVNIYRSTDFLVKYTRTPTQTVSPANQWGTEVAVVGGKVTARVDRVSGAPALAIPADGFVLSGHGASAAYLNTHAPVGATVTSPASSSPSSPPPPPPSEPPPPPPPSGAWRGEYFNNNALTGAPVHIRDDAAIDFMWPGVTPAAPGLDGSLDSARWTRTSSFAAGDYTFTVTGDDGVRVRLDGALIIDGWKTQGPTTYTAVRPLTAGNHTIVVEHFEEWGDATARFSVALGATPPPPSTGLAATGRWSVSAVNMPVRAMHATLLRDGRVLLIAGSGNNETDFQAGTFKSSIFNPATNTFTTIPTPVDMFCSGHVTLPDGRVLIQGGTASYAGLPAGEAFRGLRSSYIFDPATNAYTKVNDAIEGHWYPTLTKIETGDIWAAGGYTHKPGGGGSTSAEMFSTTQNRWLGAAEVPQHNRYLGTYPHMFLLADNRMFMTGGHTFGEQVGATGSFLHNWRDATFGDIPGLRTPVLRDQAGSVLLPPAQTQKFMIAGGGSTDYGGSTNTVDLIDMTVPNPQWTPGPTLPGPGRMYLNLTTLPDRTVLASNGSAGPRGAGGNVQAASIYDPTSNTWRTDTPSDPVGRNYHSSTILLPDGRVFAFGSDPANGQWDLRVSIYEPPYLFRGERPTVTAPATAAYGGTMSLGVTGTVVSASLVSPRSATHQTDTNARLVDLPISGTGASRTATVPSNRALLPPGPYMLTVMDDKGSVSTAKWVTVR